MKDQGPQRQELIDHLQAALAISEELRQPTTGYLIERAIDEARASMWGFDPSLKDHRPPER